MGPRTQLDTLVGVLETREESLARQLGEAQHALDEALAAEEAMRRQLAWERPHERSAAGWQACELRVERLRLALLEEQARCRRGREVVAAARAALESAHQRAEMVARAADRIRSGLVRRAEHREVRQVDELTLLRFVRAAS